MFSDNTYRFVKLLLLVFLMFCVSTLVYLLFFDIAQLKVTPSAKSIDYNEYSSTTTCLKRGFIKLENLGPEHIVKWYEDEDNINSTNKFNIIKPFLKNTSPQKNLSLDSNPNQTEDEDTTPHPYPSYNYYDRLMLKKNVNNIVYLNNELFSIVNAFKSSPLDILQGNCPQLNLIPSKHFTTFIRISS